MQNYRTICVIRVPPLIPPLTNFRIIRIFPAPAFQVGVLQVTLGNRHTQRNITARHVEGVPMCKITAAKPSGDPQRTGIGQQPAGRRFKQILPR